ncbi:restriction endonuclease subunit S [Thiothrix unzii]|jgi:type I restriction enzyme S subunit|uniref:restriction endonuclease subunit S n=1 Tax=Thiothrix unzii TaxID=111769 RepID=UPI002A363627|nr:restriction endonuclease subunit S [Thiothrix unzii]MDX9987989.1 restriction endonuclease subunit S [Thiothrix unzii]
MNTFPKYETYKDSGIEWLGEIPAGWNLVPLRSIFRFRNEKNDPIKTEEVLSLSIASGVTKYSEEGRGGNKRKDDLTAYKLARPNDIVINSMNVIVGAVGVSKYFGAISPVYYALYSNKEDALVSYYSCIFQNEGFQRGLLKLGKGILIKISDSGKMNTIRMKVSQDDLKSLYFPKPSNEEQTAIAHFLDQKTAQIDAAIAIKEQQIALLKERKQILIQQAVTQGLDPTVPMKDSGVEWIGEIPAHWEVKKIKYLAQIFRGKFTHRPRNDPALYDGEYPFFQTGDVARAGKYLKDFKQTLNEKGLKVSTLIPKGTVVITIAANIGDVAILDIDACFPDSVVGFSPNSEIDRDFLYYSLGNMKQQFMDSSIKNTQMNLNVERIGANSTCRPPLAEQIEIVQFIEVQSNKIDDAVMLQQQQIEKLREYKTTLINSAVTGKIRVTNNAVDVSI